jgi:hypothetical protein
MFNFRIGLRRRSHRVFVSAALSLGLVLSSGSAGIAAEGITWNSYAELGFGASFVGAGAKPLMAIDTGIILGSFELGTRLEAIPLEFGSPDLIQVGAARVGGTAGFRPKLGLPVTPFARLGYGHVGLGRTPESGSGDLTDLRKDVDLSVSLGVELPIGGRWSALAWGSYDYAPGAEDYEGDSLSGPSLGLSLRMTWETRIR